jgi:hypothetical protein
VRTFGSPVISEIALLEVGNVQNVLVALKNHRTALGGVEQERIQIPHHLERNGAHGGVCEMDANYLTIMTLQALPPS